MFQCFLSSNTEIMDMLIEVFLSGKKKKSWYDKLSCSTSSTLATQFGGRDSPPVRERGRLGGGGTGGTLCG